MNPEETLLKIPYYMWRDLKKFLIRSIITK